MTLQRREGETDRRQTHWCSLGSPCPVFAQAPWGPPASTSGFWTWHIMFLPGHQCSQALRFSGLSWESPFPFLPHGSPLEPQPGFCTLLGGELWLHHWLKKPGASKECSKQRTPESRGLQHLSPSLLHPAQGQNPIRNIPNVPLLMALSYSIPREGRPSRRKSEDAVSRDYSQMRFKAEYTVSQLRTRS